MALLCLAVRFISENRTDLLRRYIPQNPRAILAVLVITIINVLAAKKPESHSKL